MSVLHPNPSLPDTRDSPAGITRRKFILGSGVTAAALAIYAGEFARHEIDVTDRPIFIRDLPSPFHGFRIAQISDIHLEEFTEPWFLERVVNRINALAPNIVLLTGDFVTMGAFNFISGSNRSAERCAEVLKGITCPLRFGCLGNHDVGAGSDYVIPPLQRNGIPVLVNQAVPIDLGGSRLWICGVEDPGTSHPNLALTIPAQPNAPVILMAHEPDYADEVVHHPRFPLIDLMLSGHAHGGQVRLPFLGPIILPPMGKNYPEGHYRFNNMQLYVNRGLGTVGLPFRLNCPPEITILTLNPSV